MSFRVQNFKLDECPPYFAISYAWGSPARTRSVQVSGKRLFVTKSLISVLRDVSEFMLNVDNSGVQHFWVDGICINQEDKNERNDQVNLMADLYQKAAGVITYVGPEDDDTRPAILLAFVCKAALDSLPKAIKEAQDPEAFVTSVHSTTSSGEGIEQLGFPPINDPQYQSLRRLLRMPWSSRAWIVQESVMNQNNMMMCGTVTLKDWDLLGSVVEGVNKGCLPKQCTISVEVPEEPTPVAGSDYVHMLWSLRRAAMSDGCIDKTLLQLLRRCHSFQSSDPRDKIYAFLGMAKDRRVLGIKPAVEKPVRDVYIDAAVRILLNDTTLDLLSSVRNDKRIDLPSWVPDWSVFDFHRCGVNNYLRHAKLLNSGLYRTGSTQRSQIEFNHDRTELWAKGILYDRLQKVWFAELVDFPHDNCMPEGWRRDRREGNPLRAKFRYIEDEATNGCVSPYQTPGGFKDAFWRTLTANVTCNGAEADADFERAFDAYLDLHDAKIAEARGESIQLDAKTFSLARLYYQGISDVSVHRAIGITDKGYLASIPSNALPGDRVCVLYGGRLPYIVRQVKNQEKEKFTLLGDSYVHGIMKGEALSRLAPEDVGRIIFV